VRDVSVAFRSFVIVGFFVGRMLRGQLGVKALLRPALTKASLLFLCVATAAALLGIGDFTRESARALWTLFTSVGFYFVILSWVDSPQRTRRIFQVLLLSTIVTAAFAILQEIVGDYTSFWLFLHPPQDWFAPMEYRAPSFFANCNFLASYLNLVIPFSLACWVLGEGRWKRLGAWTTGFGVVALLCTQSLGGLVSFGGIVLLAILCFTENWKKRLSLLTAVCALAIGFYFAKETLNPAHEGAVFTYDQAIRLVLWGIAWDFFRHSPVLGVGWGNFVVLYGSYVSDISWIPEGQFEVHNIYLQLLAETGLVGFGAFSLLIFRAIQQAFRQLRCSVHTLEKALAFGALGAILSVLLHGFVDFFFQVSPQFSTLFWVLLALLVVGGKTLERKAGEQEIQTV
jgi:O-antigen ligase